MTGDPAAFCTDEHHCATCADEGVEMSVLEPARDGLALCADAGGRRRPVETALVGPVAPGDALLVHAGVALARLERSAVQPTWQPEGWVEASFSPLRRGERERG